MADVSSKYETWNLFSRIWDESSLPADERPVTLAALIYLRWADFQEAEQEAIAAFDGTDYKPVLPSSLHWRSWHQLPPKELQELFTKRLPDVLEGLNNSRHISLATHLHRIASTVKNLGRLSPQALDALVHWLAALPFETPRDRRALLDIFDAYLDRSRDKHSSEFRTPPAVVHILIALAAPAVDDRVYDPCFGTAGLLTAACDFIRQWETEKFSRSGSPQLGISGVEINLDAYIIGLVRLTLAGADDPQLELGNALERTPSNNPQLDGFDVVLANPPWGWKAQLSKDNRWGLQHFSFLTNEGSGLFVQHAIQQLKPYGRAAIVVPEGLLFRGGADQQLRRFLIEKHTVEAVVSLPETTFMPYSAIKASILVLRRGGPTKRIRMIDAKPFFEKNKNGSSATIQHAVAEEVAECLRNTEPGNHHWDIDPDTLSEVDWDLTIRRRDQSGLMGILDLLRSEVDVIPLKACSQIFSGRAIKSSDLIDAPEGEAPIPYIRIKNIQRGQASKGSSWLSQDAAASLDARWKLRTGDVLLSKSGTIGKAGVVRNGALGAVAAGGLFVLRSDPDRLDPHFLSAYLDSSECRAWLDDKARGATIRHISRRVLDEMPVPVPPLQIQHRVTAQYREHGVDALTFLAQLLTEGEEDPVAKWVDDARRHLTSEWYRDVFKNNEISGMLHGACLGGAFTGVWHWARKKEAQTNPLTAWVLSLKESVNSLQHCDDVPPGPAFYSLLQKTEANLRYAEATIAGHLPNENNARDLTRMIRERVGKAMTALIGDVRVIVSSDINKLRSDGLANIELTLANQGALPLRDFRISTTPDWGQFQIGYISEGASKTVVISGITPKGEGKFSLHVEWTGLSLDGQQVQGHREISFDLVEPTEVDRKEIEVIGGSPYVCGDPVGPERNDVFFGREELLEQIRRQIIQSGNVVLLEGNRRSGKSSILKHLEGVKAVPGWIGVYSSFQGAKGSEKSTGVPTAEVFRLIAESVSKAIYKSVDKKIPLPDGEVPPQSPKLSIKDRKRFGTAVRESISEESPFSDFCDYIEIVMEALAERELGLLLMFDEFDKLQEGIDNKVTSPQVPENIRYLIQSYPRISAILTGSRRLKRLREEYWSMLFGLGTRFSVTALPEKSARFLITSPVKNQLTYAQEAISRAIYLTACQPYLLQCLCSRVFDMAVQLKTRSVTMDLVNQAGNALVEDNEHFATMWDYVKSDRRRFILALCHKDISGPDPLRLGFVQERLITYGIEVNDETLIADLEFLRELELIELVGELGGGHYVLSIPLMGTWIEKQQDFAALLSKAGLETEDQHE